MYSDAASDTKWMHPTLHLLLEKREGGFDIIYPLVVQQGDIIHKMWNQAVIFSWEVASLTILYLGSRYGSTNPLLSVTIWTTGSFVSRHLLR